MEISARNGIKGTVESVKLGAVMASIKIKVEDPALITAAITRAIIKSTEVMVAK